MTQWKKNLQDWHQLTRLWTFMKHLVSMKKEYACSFWEQICSKHVNGNSFIWKMLISTWYDHYIVLSRIIFHVPSHPIQVKLFLHWKNSCLYLQKPETQINVPKNINKPSKLPIDLLIQIWSVGNFDSLLNLYFIVNQ